MCQSSHKFISNICPRKLFETDVRTAEMVKLTENASRDVIAFANELSLICDELDINVELIDLANDQELTYCTWSGVGGHCIAVDLWFIASASPDKSNNKEEVQRIMINPSGLLKKL